MKPLICWESIRKFCNKFGLRTVVESLVIKLYIIQGLSVCMFVVTILNCSLIIAAFFINDTDILTIFDTLDTVFLAIFIFECAIKIISLGVYDFFKDSWYKFPIN